MKKLSILAALIFVTTLAFAQKSDFNVDTKKSKLAWIGKKITGQHNGEVFIKKGAVQVDGGKLVGGSFDIDMNTISVLDLQGEWGGKLLGHLKSDDFFSVEKFPVATFQISKVEAIKGAAAGQPNHTITGNLTIKGITHAVSFPAVVTVDKKSLTAVGDVKIDRTKWDIKYGSASFFDSLGDKAIDNEFAININLSAAK